MITVLRAIVILAAPCAFAAAQTMVEYGVKAGSTAPASAGMKKVGDALKSTLDKAGGQVAKSSTVILVDTGKAPPRRPASEPPSGITAGLSTEELLKRFGDPDLKTSLPDGSTKYWYGGVIAIVEKDKVTTVSKSEKASSSVVILQ